MLNLWIATSDERIDNPTQEQVVSAIKGLDPSDEDPFLVLNDKSNESTFMQALRKNKTLFFVEYREGDTGEQFATRKLVRVGTVERLFLAYLRGDDSYKTAVEWEDITDHMPHGNLRQRVISFAENLIQAFSTCQLRLPDEDDCPLCRVRIEGVPMGEVTHTKGHLIIHVRESYYAPSLLMRAMEVCGVQPMAWDYMHAKLFDGSGRKTEVPGWGFEWWNDLAGEVDPLLLWCLEKHMLQQFGLAAPERNLSTQEAKPQRSQRKGRLAVRKKTEKEEYQEMFQRALGTSMLPAEEIGILGPSDDSKTPIPSPQPSEPNPSKSPPTPGTDSAKGETPKARVTRRGWVKEDDPIHTRGLTYIMGVKLPKKPSGEQTKKPAKPGKSKQQ